MRLEPRILIVEDDPLVGALFHDYFPDRGFNVDVVTSSQSALEALSALPYDLVMADKNMPVLNGFDLLKHVKERYADLDVIIMTGDRDIESVLLALDAGVYDYLVKPFESMEAVLQKVRRVLEKRHIVLENRRLLQYLRQANEQIEGMNRSLEALVVERTKQLEDANIRLAQLTITDDVTGLFNQRFLYQRLDEEFRRARRHGIGLTVMMADIDNFKLVNDEHDHIYGSQVLARVGDLFTKGVRRIDMVIRYGGDEFVILMPHTNLVEARAVGDRLRVIISRTDVGVPEDPYRVTVSIGIAELMDCGAETPHALLQAADKALYAAKAAGRNRVAVMHGESPVAVVA